MSPAAGTEGALPAGAAAPEAARGLRLILEQARGHEVWFALGAAGLLLLTGAVALWLWRTPDPSISHLRRLVRLLWRYWPRLAAYFAGMAVFALVMGVQPLVLQGLLGYLGLKLDLGPQGSQVTRDVLNGLLGLDGQRSTADLLRFLGFFSACAVLAAGGSFTQRYYEGWFTWRAVVDLRLMLCRHLVHQPLSFFDARRQGDLLSRTTNDLNNVRLAVGLLFEDFLFEPFQILAFLASALLLSWKLSLLVFVVIPLVMVFFIQIGRRIRHYARRGLDCLGDVTDSMVQMFGGIRVVRAFRLEEAQLAEFAAHNQRFFRASRNMERQKALIKGLTEFAAVFGSAGLFLAFGFGLLDVPAATFLSFLFIPPMIMGSFKKLTRAYNRIQEALAGADRVFGLMQENPLPADDPGARPLAGLSAGLAFRGVGFAYRPGEPVLQGIELEARRGETIALVGHSGAGKSTLLDLIPRFYDPQEGRIEVDGRDLRSCTRASLLQQIAIVSQEPFLFNTSIRENIAYGRPGATEAEIQAAAAAARVDEFAARLPGGLAANVGERGDNLSGGERQRVTIARAILKDAPILLLDEATSSLDSRAERLVQEALAGLMKGRLTFVIAHRLSTIRHADRIVVLERGQIRETGTHDELLARSDSLYRQVYREQVGGE